jgi:hypothetical protein
MVLAACAAISLLAAAPPSERDQAAPSSQRDDAAPSQQRREAAPEAESRGPGAAKARVVSLHELLTLTERYEPDLRERLEQIAWHRAPSTALTFMGGAIAFGGFFALGAFSICQPSSGCVPPVEYKTGGILIGTGLAVLAIAVLVAPSPDDYRGVVQAWNARHPERPLEWENPGAP